VPKVAVAKRRTHFGADHAVRSVSQFVDVGRFDRLGETWPTAPRIEFVGRGEQWLAQYDINVDSWLFVIQILPRSGTLCAVLLGHAILFW
jgi:hypothetical protein